MHSLHLSVPPGVPLDTCVNCQQLRETVVAAGGVPGIFFWLWLDHFPVFLGSTAIPHARAMCYTLLSGHVFGRADWCFAIQCHARFTHFFFFFFLSSSGLFRHDALLRLYVAAHLPRRVEQGHPGRLPERTGGAVVVVVWGCGDGGGGAAAVAVAAAAAAAAAAVAAMVVVVVVMVVWGTRTARHLPTAG